MGTVFQDVRHTLRMLRNNPGFTAVAVLTLALGIGANTAIFSVVNGVVLKPLPYPEHERLVSVYNTNQLTGYGFDVASYPDFKDYAERSRTLEHFSAYFQMRSLLAGRDEQQPLVGAAITHELFAALGVAPALGRAFTEQEDSPGGPPAVILGYGTWQQKLGGDPNIVGQVVHLGEKSVTVVGVMPAGFQFPVDRRSEFWLPLGNTLAPQRVHARDSHSLSLLARLKPGVSRETADQELAAIARDLERQYPASNKAVGARLIGLQEDLIGDIRPALLVLLGAVGFVLLIACANVANLLLARATARQKEMAIRSALGASRQRVLRQLLTESLVLSLTGAIAGVALAVGGLKLLVALRPDVPRLSEVTVDMHVLLFALAAALVTGALFGLIPAVQAARVDVNESLKGSARGTTGGAGHHRARNVLVAGEIAVSLLLLVGAALLMESFMKLRSVSTGFQSAGVFEVTLTPPKAKYETPEQKVAYQRGIEERVANLPGVESAGLVELMPFAGSVSFQSFHVVGGRAYASGEEPVAEGNSATPGYFETMRIPVLRGRAFSPDEVAARAPVVLINESFAREHFRDQDPVGRQLVIGQGDINPNPPPRQIVGVVGDVRGLSLGQAAGPQYYVPSGQESLRNWVTVVVRGAGNTNPSADVRAALKQIDSALYVPQLRPVAELVTGSTDQQRFSAVLLGMFAMLALLLAAIGIYGVGSYSVAERTHELGIRMALGAKPAAVLRMVLSDALRIAGVGAG